MAAKKPRAKKRAKIGGRGGTGASSADQPSIDSAPENFSTVDEPAQAADTENDWLKKWKARKDKGHAAKRVLRELPASEYEDVSHAMVHHAPTIWHLKILLFQTLQRLKSLCRGHGDTWLGIPDKNPDIIASAHYELAQVVAKFNQSLTAKSTPPWLQPLKAHPAFQKAWKASRKTKREHKREGPEHRVIEVPSYSGLTLRCVFSKHSVQMEWRRGSEIVRHDKRERISSQGVLQHWLADVLTDFDKHQDYPGSPMSYDWAVRWADEALYIKHFMLHAEREWNPHEVDALQARACGILTLNNGKDGGKPRYDFQAFRGRIKRLALRQIRSWRDNIVPPAPKV